MTKKMYIVILLIYLALAVGGMADFFSNAWLDGDTWTGFVKKHLAICLLLAGITGMLGFMSFKKIFAAWYEKKRKRYGFDYYFPALTVLFMFVVNTGIIIAINSVFGYDKKIEVHGIIANTSTTYEGRNGMLYYVTIDDTVTHKRYWMRVKKNVFLQSKQNNTINKEFYLGKLGIMYRREE
jgi:hypothetical protein